MDRTVRQLVKDGVLFKAVSQVLEEPRLDHHKFLVIVSKRAQHNKQLKAPQDIWSRPMLFKAALQVLKEMGL